MRKNFWFDERCWSKYPEDKLITISELVSKYNSNLAGLRILIHNRNIGTYHPFNTIRTTPDLLYILGEGFNSVPDGSKYAVLKGTIIAPEAKSVSLESQSSSDFNMELIAPKCSELYIDIPLISRVRDDAVKFPQTVTKLNFSSCYSLKTIPRFVSKMSLSNARNLFSSCSSLTIIPSWVFESAKLKNIDSCFEGCSQLTTVEPNIFNKSNISASCMSVERLFYECKRLVNVPNDLFSAFTNVTKMRNIFFKCEALETVPDNIFTPLINLDTAQSLFWMSGLTKIPTSFMNLVKLVDISNCFSNCAFTSIPELLFDKMASLKVVTSAFYGTRLTHVPKLMRRGILVSANSIFSHCSLITSMSADIFGEQPELTTLASAFSNCNIKTLPVNMFPHILPKLTNIDYMFDCSKNVSPETTYGFSSVPNDLFKNMPNIITARYAFAQTSVTSIPSDLLSNNPKLEIMDNMFLKCGKLVRVPDNLLANNHRVKNISTMFSYNIALEYSPVNLFLPCATSLTSATNVYANCPKLPASCIPDFTDKSVYPNIK